MSAEVMQHNYRIEPVVLPKSESGELVPMRGGIDLVVAGSLTSTPDLNQAQFGEFIAGLVASEVRTAGWDGKLLLLDAATGSSPAAAWAALQKTDFRKKSNVIIMGHEEAWGPKPGSSTDFDGARRSLLESNDQTVVPISSIDEAQGDLGKGNFIPMHFVNVGRGNFPEGDEGEAAYQGAQEEAAVRSAGIYTEIVRAVRRRKDVVSMGIYGIGKDGHIGEWQKKDMGIHALTKQGSFVQPQEDYSIEVGDFVWAGDIKNENNNLYWKRGLKRGQPYGRAEWQPGMGGQEVVMGLGLRDMLALDHVVLAFNNESKSFAFQLAMEGSVDGILGGEKMETAVNRDKGEGEAIWPELASYGLKLEKSGVLVLGTVEGIINAKVEAVSKIKDKTERPEDLKCGLLYKEIYKALDQQQATADNPIYAKMGEFTNRYVGKRSPLGQFIRMRALLGKRTTIVATPEVVKGTRYEFLAV